GPEGPWQVFHGSISERNRTRDPRGGRGRWTDLLLRTGPAVPQKRGVRQPQRETTQRRLQLQVRTFQGPHHGLLRRHPQCLRAHPAELDDQAARDTFEPTDAGAGVVIHG
ncbi:unnamed protein product, partial [Ixodes pacificus]